MKIKKYAGGGVQFAPVVADYTTGILSVLSQNQGTSTSSTSSQLQSLFGTGEKGAIGILNKTMTDALVKDTLPNEAQYIINNTDIFGQYIDPNNPSASTALYSDILQKMQLAKYNKEMFSDAVTKAREKQSLKGPAINSDGTVWVKTSKGLGKKYVDDVTPRDELVTVAELSQLRAYNPNFAFNQDIIATIDNSTSLKEIQDIVNSIISHIEKYEEKRDYYGTKDDLRKIEGLRDILSGSSAEGIYKGTIEHSSNTAQAQHLLNYIYSVLEPSQRSFLEVMVRKAGLISVVDKKTGKKVDGVLALLAELIQGKHYEKIYRTLDFQKDQTEIIYGKSSKSGSGSDQDLEDIKPDPVTLFAAEMGEKELFTIQIGGTRLRTMGTVTNLYDSNGNALDWTSLTDVGKSMFAKTLNVDQAHFGSYKVSDRDKIQVDGTKVVNMYLPIDLNAKAKGETMPDFKWFALAAKLQKQTANMTDIDQINRIYQQNGLPAVFKIDGTGQRVVTPSYARFAVMEAYADRKSVPKKDVNGKDFDLDLETVAKVDDDNVVETVIERFKKINDKYTESKAGGWAGLWKHPDLYQGMVFIPIKSSPIAALPSGVTMRNARRLETAYDKAQNNQSRYNSNTIQIKEY